jgi:hypothetical protein
MVLIYRLRLCRNNCNRTMRCRVIPKAWKEVTRTNTAGFYLANTIDVYCRGCYLRVLSGSHSV